MRRWEILVLAAALLAGGCATLSEGECLTADWYRIGLEDANRGHDLGRLDSHRDACLEHGIRPDANAYAGGHRDGLESFCTARRGYSYGREGSYYRQTCPVELEPEFLDGYRLGSEIHRAEQELNTLRNEINELEDDLEDAADDDERRQLRREIDELDERRRYLRRHIDRLESQADLW